MPHPLIAKLDLSPHPEGGWYRETMRQPAPDGGRGLATAILFLLEDGQRSHWHRVDATRTMAVARRIAADAADRAGGNMCWAATRSRSVPAMLAANARTGNPPRRVTGWALVSCVVTPAFDFAGFELAHQAGR